MYRPTFAFDAIGRNDPTAVRIGMRIMAEAVDFLARADVVYFEELGLSQFPPLYEAHVRYGDDKPAPGTACGDDDWRDVAVLYNKRVGDCEELAAARLAELRYRWSVRAVPAVLLQREGSRRGGRGLHLFHVMVRWPEDLLRYPSTVRRRYGMMLECPSEVLGMTPASYETAAA
jgi:hypothetical protein